MSFIIAGGGTGGHVFIGVAVADALKKKEPRANILFVGTEKGLEVSAVPKAGYELELIAISGIKGKSRFHQIRALFQLPKAIAQSIKILRERKPRAILGVGGYASGPVLIAAFLLRIPFALCEPNSVPGLTNRVLGKISRLIFTTFDRTGTFFSKKKVRLVGNPVRNEMQVAPLKEIGQGKLLNILVLGGSQGARSLNQRLPECLAEIKKQGLDLKIVHQSGVSDFEDTSRLYRELNLNAEVYPFIDNMSEAYSQADILICRAGATTCAEVLAVGPVALFVPLPNAIYDHQMLNARELVEKGAALLVAQDQIAPAGIAKIVTDLIKDPERYRAMSARARKLAKPNAAAEIAESFINCF